MFLHSLYCLGYNNLNNLNWGGAYFTYKYMNRNKENICKIFVYHAKN